MIAAVEGGHHGLVAWLLERGANVNARAARLARHSALHAAAWNGDLRMVELLVEAGADVAALDEQYQATPAGWADTAIEVTRNATCAEVVAYLEALRAD
jgi:ankyrin repeat protein